MGVFIPHDKLANLKAYKYQSEDRSIVSKYVLRPFWAQFVKIFPLWMAPNVVTLSGFGFIVLNLLTALYYDPTLSEPSPRWTYFSYAFGLFMYQTFDACDGGHARRTGQSGPLGELFDHCIDSVNTSLSLLVFASAAGLGWGKLLMVSQFSVLCNFYLSTWEEFHTHTLFLSEFSGPVEGILGLCGLLMLTGLTGQWIWKYEFFSATIGGIPVSINSMTLYVVFGGISLGFNVLSAARNAIRYYKGDKAKSDEAIEGLVPFFVYFTSVFVVIFYEPGFIGFPFFISVGFTMAFVVGRIIISHLTIQEFPHRNPPMYIPVAQLALYIISTTIFNFDKLTTIFALSWLGCGLALGIHAMFINEIIYEITTYLDIYALSIKHPKTA